MNHSRLVQVQRRMWVCTLAAFFGIITFLGFPMQYASAATTEDPTYDRIGYFWYTTTPSGLEVGMVLAAQRWRDGKYPEYCVQERYRPVPPAHGGISAGNITQPTVAVDGYQLSTAQMAWLMVNYAQEKNATAQAAISFLAHVNFEQSQDDSLITSAGFQSIQEYAQWIAREAEKEVPHVVARSKAMIQEAREATISGHGTGSVVGAGKRMGTYEGFSVMNAETNQPVAGIPVAATLEGPAVWDDTGTQTLTVTTGKEPIVKGWHATAHGHVSLTLAYEHSPSTLEHIVRDVYQDTVTIPGEKVQVQSEKYEWDVIFDFRPQGVSHVQKVFGSQEFTDELSAAADPNYGNGEWLTLGDVGLEGEGGVPVVYTARAYHVPALELPIPSSDIPQDAVLVGEKKMTAHGQSTLEARFSAPNPGWYVVVWSVDSQSQSEKWAPYIHAGWNDGWAVADETSSRTYPAQIDTAISVRSTKAGQYLVDDVWVSGMPDNHPNFTGGLGFGADEKTITHKLLFFPQGLDVKEENREKAELIGKPISIPAANGFYPTMGDTSWRIRTDKEGRATAGTYVFVSEFIGDDRVAPLVTSVEDVAEQFVVTAEPQIHTTLTHDNSREKIPAQGMQTLVDIVTYTNLIPGKEYQVEGKLMDKATGKPLVDRDGRAVTASATHTPQKSNGTFEVKFYVDAAQFAKVTTVAFETMKPEDGDPIVHADLHNANQTLLFDSEPPQPSKELARTGILFPAIGSLAGALLASGGAVYSFRRRQK